MPVGDMLGNAIRRNVALNVQKLKNATPILNEFASDAKIRLVGGVYELKTGRVQLRYGAVDISYLLMFIVSALPILFASELRNNSRFRGLSNLYCCSDRNMFALTLIHRNS